MRYWWYWLYTREHCLKYESPCGLGTPPPKKVKGCPICYPPINKPLQTNKTTDSSLSPTNTSESQSKSFQSQV
jgi:hypothetical protein